MAVTVKDVYEFLQEKAPFELQMGFDNAGFLVGRGGREVDKILVALDITENVVEEARQVGAQLIVSHHPVIWGGAKSITDETVMGRKLLSLTESGIAAICAHTNLDAVAEGVNDALAEALGLTEIAQLKQDGVDGQGRPYGIGRIGLLPAGCDTCAQFARRVKELLGSNGVRYVDAGKPVRIVAVGGGSCSDMMDDALAQGCDTFLTADVKYDGFLDARAKGLNLIDEGHYPTENVICPVLADWLSERFPGVETVISEDHHEVFDYL